MSRVDDRQPVQTFGPSRSHEAFGNSIRLRDLNWRPSTVRVFGSRNRIEAARELGVVIANQKPNRFGALTERPRDLPAVGRRSPDPRLFHANRISAPHTVASTLRIAESPD